MLAVDHCSLAFSWVIFPLQRPRTADHLKLGGSVVSQVGPLFLRTLPEYVDYME